MEPNGNLQRQTAINPGSAKLEKQILRWYESHSTLTGQAAAPFPWQSRSRSDPCRSQSSPRSGPGMGLFVPLVLTGQGCSWGSACSTGIRGMGSVKRGIKTKCTLCSVHRGGLDVRSDVQGGTKGSPNTPKVPGHHSWAGWAGMSRIFC